MYKVIFEDGTVFNGGEPENSRWNEIPNKPIAEIEYWLGKHIHLKNYEAYNHLTKYAFRVDNQQQSVVAVIILDKILNIVQRFCFDLIKRELIIDEVPFGIEYNNKPASGWKTGLSNLKTEYKID